MLRSTVFIYSKFTWCRSSRASKVRMHHPYRGNEAKLSSSSSTAYGMYYKTFLRSPDFNECFTLDLARCDTETEEGLSLWQAQAYVPATRRKQLKDNFQLQAELERSCTRESLHSYWNNHALQKCHMDILSSSH